MRTIAALTLTHRKARYSPDDIPYPYSYPIPSPNPNQTVGNSRLERKGRVPLTFLSDKHGPHHPAKHFLSTENTLDTGRRCRGWVKRQRLIWPSRTRPILPVKRDIQPTNSPRILPLLLLLLDPDQLQLVRALPCHKISHPTNSSNLNTDRN